MSSSEEIAHRDPSEFWADAAAQVTSSSVSHGTTSPASLASESWIPPTVYLPVQPEEARPNWFARRTRRQKAAIGAVAAVAAIGVAAGVAAAESGGGKPKLNPAEQLAQDAQSNPIAFANDFVNDLMDQDTDAILYPFLTDEYKKSVSDPQGWINTSGRIANNFASLRPAHPRLTNPGVVSRFLAEAGGGEAIFDNMDGADGSKYITLEMIAINGSLQVDSIGWYK